MPEIRTTTCVMDCPDACALEVEVDAGRVETIRGSRDHPDSAFICSKVAHFGRRLYHDKRLLYPLRRVGAKGEGRFERISWEEATAEIVGRFEEISARWGAEAILPFHYGGSNGYLTDDLTDALFFSRLGASRLAKTICAVPATEVAGGMYGKMPGVAFGDYVHARCIVVWGANPRGSNIHLVPYLQEAKRQGAFVATVDPRRRLPRRDIDLHLPVLPGQDLPLALAMVRRWREREELDRTFLAENTRGVEMVLEQAAGWPLERAAAVTGLDASDIVRLADVMAASSPCVVRCGWGLERNRNGAQAIAAVLAIPALLGKFGVRGGGYTLSNNGAARFDRDRLIGPLDSSTRELNMTQLGRLLNDADLSPPLKAVLVYNANPAATVPQQDAVLRGLEREDLFTVVHDQVMTDTALYADLVLPAVTFLEGHDLRVGYGNYVVGGIRPVVEPAGEARSNMQLFSALGRAMGFEDDAFGWDDAEILARAAAATELSGSELDSETVAAGGRVAYAFEGGTPVQFDNTLPYTADRKVDLTPAVLGEVPYAWAPPDNGYPLALVSPASSKLVTSTMGEFNERTLYVTMHPSDAAARRLSNGERVRVFNERGEVHCLLRVRDAVRPGVASMPKGVWRDASLNGSTATALCPDHVQQVSGAACFNDARVEVEAL